MFAWFKAILIIMDIRYYSWENAEDILNNSIHYTLEKNGSNCLYMCISKHI